MVNFMTSVPAGSGHRLPVVIHEIPWSLIGSGRCNMWASLVHDKFIKIDPTRADRDWEWRVLIPITTFGGGLKRRPRMFQIASAASDFPLGMVALLENERWIGNEKQTAVYVWYVTGAPKAAVAHLGTPGLLTVAALDIAVTCSLNDAARGKLWLHAAPRGGANLMNWHRSLKLEEIPANEALPGIRTNDGRYFRLDDNLSAQFSLRYDGYRV